MITVFGSINMDLIATTARLPKPGETVAGTDFSTAAGGKGANQALAARRAGASVRMAGAVGSDAFAEGALALLKEAGTDLDLTKTVGEPTGTAHIIVGGDGENVIVVVASANARVSGDDAANVVAQMSAGDTLMLQLEIPSASVEKALSEAKRRGIRSIINIAPLTPDAARLGRMADIVIANETEFELLAGKAGIAGAEREEAMNGLHAETRQTVIVTLGAEGVVAIHEGELHRAKGAHDRARRYGRCRRYVLRLSRRRPRRRSRILRGAPPRRDCGIARLPQARRAALDTACRRGRRPALGHFQEKCVAVFRPEVPSFGVLEYFSVSMKY
ncbi:ribokinase [Sinorhizobium meliloti]